MKNYKRQAYFANYDVTLIIILLMLVSKKIGKDSRRSLGWPGRRVVAAQCMSLSSKRPFQQKIMKRV